MNKAPTFSPDMVLPGIGRLLLKQAFREAKIKVARRLGVRNITDSEVHAIMGLSNDVSMISKVLSGTSSEHTLAAVLQFIIFADPKLLPPSAQQWLRDKEQPTTPEAIKDKINLESLQI